MPRPTKKATPKAKPAPSKKPEPELVEESDSDVEIDVENDLNSTVPETVLSESSDDGESEHSGSDEEEENEAPPPKKAATKKAVAKTATKKAATPKKAAATKKAAKEDAAPKKAATPKKTATKKAAKEDAAPKKAATPKKAAAKKAPKKEEAEVEDGKRTFKLLVSSVNPPVEENQLSGSGGRYVGRTPMQAAKKTFTQLARKVCGGEACDFTFTIQESTQGSDKKQFSYTGERVELEEPQTINRAGAEYAIRFKNNVKAVKKGAE